MQKVKIRVRKKGQITLPQLPRDRWKIGEGSEILLIAEKDRAVLKPVKRTKVREEAGTLGGANRDEVKFAVLDPELVSQYYSKK